MNSDGCWEFDCPQFVDFASGLDSSPIINNVWLGSSKKERRHKTMFNLTTPKFGPKMCTPKFKTNRVLKSAFVSIQPPLQTDDEKWTVKNVRRRSRSQDNLNLLKPVESQELRHLNLHNGLRRSLSDNFINTKKRTNPKTPMCLKRTLSKPKFKGKTTEELEMEKINELQSKLSRQLKLNEVNLQRMKNNKTPFVMEDFYKIKPKIDVHPVKEEAKDLKANPREFLNDLRKNFRKQRFENEDLALPGGSKQQSNNLSIRTKAERLQKVLKPIQATNEKSSKVLHAKNHEGDLEKTLLGEQKSFAKYKAHSGLKFLMSENSTLPRPFSFDTSSTSSNSSFRFKDNKKLQ